MIKPLNRALGSAQHALRAAVLLLALLGLSLVAALIGYASVHTDAPEFVMAGLCLGIVLLAALVAPKHRQGVA